MTMPCLGHKGVVPFLGSMQLCAALFHAPCMARCHSTDGPDSIGLVVGARLDMHRLDMHISKSSAAGCQVAAPLPK